MSSLYSKRVDILVAECVGFILETFSHFCLSVMEPPYFCIIVIMYMSETTFIKAIQQRIIFLILSL